MLAPPIAPGRELELKFELPGDDFYRLGESPLLKGAAGANARKTLRSIYFDTPGHGLHKARISLRLRNDGGKKWIQTVKTGEVTSGLSNVGEIEARVDRCEPDLDRIGDKQLRQTIKSISRDGDLRPVFETIVGRTTQVITNEDCSVELALDEGRVEANGRSRELREAELELLSGSVQGLLAVARALFSDFRIRPSEWSKAERGYRLLRQDPDEIASPSFAKDVTLRQSDSTRDAFAAILQSTSQHVIANERMVVEAGDIEAVHQLRVGLTRLRAALRSIRSYTSAPWIAELERDAQTVARAVGPLRDADVLIGEIYTPIAEEHNDGVPGFPGLLQALKAHREATHKEVVDKLDKGIWSRLLVTLVLSPQLIETGGRFEEPVATLASESLERRWKAVRKYGERVETLDLEELHSMRKALKKLRYNCEFFQTLYDDEAQSFVKRLKKMQELFGAINDARMAERLIGVALERRRRDSKALAAAGYILGRHEAKVPLVWSKAKREWERLEKASGFWR